MRRILLVTAAALMMATPAFAADKATWVPTWFAPPEPVADAPAMLQDQTVRQVVHTTAGGNIVRLKVSNAYGAAPLHIDGAAVGDRANGGNVLPGTNATVAFGGKADIIIPAGAYALSDPVTFAVAPQSDLVVSIYVKEPAAISTVHIQQRNAVFYAAGDATRSDTIAPVAGPANSDWVPWLSEVEVTGGTAVATVVTFGDSITDGAGPAHDLNRTWPDDLYGRFVKAGIKLSVTNAGITGNRLLHHGSWAPFGIGGLARFDSDVLAQPNVKAVIVLIGINDIGHPGGGAPLSDLTPPEEMEAGLSQLAARAHEHNIKIYIATMTPFKDTVFKGYYSDDKEVQRQAVNAWIRTTKVFDGYADFDKALDDPARPGFLRPDYDSGDHLHPSAAGDAAMADTVPLAWFK